MDDLTFRKTVYADPFTKDPAVIKAAKEDPKKQAFWNEIKAMESELKAAMDVSVPENLAERLILRQSLKQHSKVSKQRPWLVALAASVLVASIVTVSLITGGHSRLTNDVFAHLNHLEAELKKSNAVDMASVNSMLASFNGQVNDDLGEIVSANYCYLDKIKSLHMIIRSDNGLTSLFIVPDSITDSISDTFSNASFEGAAFLLESAKIIIVGKTKTDVHNLEQRAKRSLAFSA